MPEELWGRDEDLLWYSSGGQCGTRTQDNIAEGLAYQAPGMGQYCYWKDPDGRKAFIDYFHFAEEFEDYFHPVKSHAEVTLLFPR